MLIGAERVQNEVELNRVLEEWQKTSDLWRLEWCLIIRSYNYNYSDPNYGDPPLLRIVKNKQNVELLVPVLRAMNKYFITPYRDQLSEAKGAEQKLSYDQLSEMKNNFEKAKDIIETALSHLFESDKNWDDAIVNAFVEGMAEVDPPNVSPQQRVFNDKLLKKIVDKLLQTGRPVEHIAPFVMMVQSNAISVAERKELFEKIINKILAANTPWETMPEAMTQLAHIVYGNAELFPDPKDSKESNKKYSYAALLLVLSHSDEYADVHLKVMCYLGIMLPTEATLDYAQCSSLADLIESLNTKRLMSAGVFQRLLKSPFVVELQRQADKNKEAANELGKIYYEAWKLAMEMPTVAITETKASEVKDEAVSAMQFLKETVKYLKQAIPIEEAFELLIAIQNELEESVSGLGEAEQTQEIANFLQKIKSDNPKFEAMLIEHRGLLDEEKLIAEREQVPSKKSFREDLKEEERIKKEKAEIILTAEQKKQGITADQIIQDRQREEIRKELRVEKIIDVLVNGLAALEMKEEKASKVTQAQSVVAVTPTMEAAQGMLEYLFKFRDVPQFKDRAIKLLTQKFVEGVALPYLSAEWAMRFLLVPGVREYFANTDVLGKIINFYLQQSPPVANQLEGKIVLAFLEQNAALCQPNLLPRLISQRSKGDVDHRIPVVDILASPNLRAKLEPILTLSAFLSIPNPEREFHWVDPRNAVNIFYSYCLNLIETRESSYLVLSHIANGIVKFFCTPLAEGEHAFNWYCRRDQPPSRIILQVLNYYSYLLPEQQKQLQAWIASSEVNIAECTTALAVVKLLSGIPIDGTEVDFLIYHNTWPMFNKYKKIEDKKTEDTKKLLYLVRDISYQTINNFNERLLEVRHLLLPSGLARLFAMAQSSKINPHLITRDYLLSQLGKEEKETKAADAKAIEQQTFKQALSAEILKDNKLRGALNLIDVLNLFQHQARGYIGDGKILNKNACVNLIAHCLAHSDYPKHQQEVNAAIGLAVSQLKINNNDFLIACLYENFKLLPQVMPLLDAEGKARLLSYEEQYLRKALIKGNLLTLPDILAILKDPATKKYIGANTKEFILSRFQCVRLIASCLVHPQYKQSEKDVDAVIRDITQQLKTDPAEFLYECIFNYEEGSFSFYKQVKEKYLTSKEGTQAVLLWLERLEKQKCFADHVDLLVKKFESDNPSAVYPHLSPQNVIDFFIVAEIRENLPPKIQLAILDYYLTNASQISYRLPDKSIVEIMQGYADICSDHLILRFINGVDKVKPEQKAAVVATAERKVEVATIITRQVDVDRTRLIFNSKELWTRLNLRDAVQLYSHILPEQTFNQVYSYINPEQIRKQCIEFVAYCFTHKEYQKNIEEVSKVVKEIAQRLTELKPNEPISSKIVLINVLQKYPEVYPGIKDRVLPLNELDYQEIISYGMAALQHNDLDGVFQAASLSAANKNKMRIQRDVDDYVTGRRQVGFTETETSCFQRLIDFYADFQQNKMPMKDDSFRKLCEVFKAVPFSTPEQKQTPPLLESKAPAVVDTGEAKETPSSSPKLTWLANTHEKLLEEVDAKHEHKELNDKEALSWKKDLRYSAYAAFQTFYNQTNPIGERLEQLQWAREQDMFTKHLERKFDVGYTKTIREGVGSLYKGLLPSIKVQQENILKDRKIVPPEKVKQLLQNEIYRLKAQLGIKELTTIFKVGADDLKDSIKVLEALKSQATNGPFKEQFQQATKSVDKDTRKNMESWGDLILGSAASQPRPP